MSTTHCNKHTQTQTTHLHARIHTLEALRCYRITVTIHLTPCHQIRHTALIFVGLDGANELREVGGLDVLSKLGGCVEVGSGLCGGLCGCLCGCGCGPALKERVMCENRSCDECDAVVICADE